MVVRVEPPFDITVDFWKNNYAVSLVKPFDKIKRLKSGSKIMWSIWLLVDPSQYNPLRRLNEDERLSAIKRYYKNFDPEKSVVSEAIDVYEQLLLSPAARAFKEEERGLVKRSKLIRSLQDEFEKLVAENPLALADKDYKSLLALCETMIKNSPTAYKQYDEVKKTFEQEQMNIRIHGGGSESLIEKGGLKPIEDD